MRVGVVGTGARAAARAAILRSLPHTELAATCTAASEGGLDAFTDRVEAAFVAVPTADHFAVARALARRGVHLFLEWPPAVSVRECEALVRLAEEAGVEIGLSRPLRFHPLFGLAATWRPALVVVRHDVAEGAVAARSRLADAIDVCCALVGSASVQRIDAEAARGATVLPDAVAFGLRFHNGAYAQVAFTGNAATDEHTLYAAGGGHHLRADLLGHTATLDGSPPSCAAPRPDVAETAAFLAALATHRAPDVTALDGLHTMRLVERLMARLR